MTTLTCGHCRASFTHDHYCPVGAASPSAPAELGQIALLWNAVSALQIQVEGLTRRLALIDARLEQSDGGQDG